MIIGIDLGTTNSLVAVWRDGKSQVIPNSLNQNLTPSVVGIDENGIILVGQAAKERLSTHPDLTTANFKRYMGTEREVSLGEKCFRAEELSAFVIRSLKQDAESFLGESVTEAIITVPAYFSDAQRKATKVAGELAGLKVERLLNEPTAAAMAYGIHTSDDESRYLIFDLGGGTFDISILEIFDGVMEVHASAGDNHLGGTDFTEALAKDFIASKKTELKDENEELPAELRERINIQAEKVKRELADKGTAKFSLNWQDQLIEYEINETEFDKLTEPLVERLSRPIRGALRDAKVMVEDINEIVLVGGATRMPNIRKLATRLFHRFPATGINPDEVVVQGAAIQAGLKARDEALDDLVMTDVCPYTLGVEVAGGNQSNSGLGHFHPIIERNNYIPVSRIERLFTVRDNQKAVDVKIYQGENPLVKDNVYLGKLSVKVPPNPEGQESIDVRFTYDINGLLEVIVTVVSTQAQHSMVIEENPGVLSQEEIQARFRALESIKIHPREQQDNMVIINRSERLYRELLGDERAFLGQWIARFHQELDKQNPREIAAMRKEFEAVLDQLEGNYRF